MAEGGAAADEQPRVTFAPMPTSDGKHVDDTEDASKSRDDLLSTLSHLRSDLAQARMDLSAEKAIRKRKEKNLVKLAKQLNSRTTTIETQKNEIDTLTAAQTKLDSRLESTRHELEQLTERHEKASRDHHTEITEQQMKHRELCRQHDDRVEEITLAHGRQCAQLRRDLLQSQLDADRLRTQIASVEMQKNPEGADEVVSRTMRESSMALPSSGSSSSRVALYISIALLAVLGILVLIAAPILLHGASAGDAMCSPAKPGMNLIESSYVGEAPWWAPNSHKKNMFSLLCDGSRTRTRVEWSGGNGKYKLVVSAPDANGSRGKAKQHILVEKKAIIARISANKIQATYSSGKSENISAPWLKQ